MSQIVVAALYKFVKLPDYETLVPQLKDLCDRLGIKGTLLLAEEGINGTVAGSREAIDSLMAFLHNDGRFENLSYKESFYDEQPFYRMKVKLKKEIVTLGVAGIDPGRRSKRPRAWDRRPRRPFGRRPPGRHRRVAPC